MIKTFILLLLLIAAAYYDWKEQKIPNWLVFIGIFTGFLFCHTISDMLMKFAAMVGLFFVGMFRLMGHGDLKLWMVLVCYLGFLDSFWIMGVAAILLILYGAVTNWKETFLIFRHIYLSVLHKQLPYTIEQKAYPFAPFILMSFILMWGGGII